jgi:hypothetical protein
MIYYDEMVLLSNIISTTNVNVEFIIATFNQNTWEVMHVIAIYKPLKMYISYVISIFKNILKNNSHWLSNVMIRNFNVNMLTSTSQPMMLQIIMNKYGFKNNLPFKKEMIYNT